MSEYSHLVAFWSEGEPYLQDPRKAKVYPLGPDIQFEALRKWTAANGVRFVAPHGDSRTSRRSFPTSSNTWAVVG